jgi:hypothetical protein
MDIKYTNIFFPRPSKNLPKFGFFVFKYTIWQPWFQEFFVSVRPEVIAGPSEAASPDAAAPTPSSSQGQPGTGVRGRQEGFEGGAEPAAAARPAAAAAVAELDPLPTPSAPRVAHSLEQRHGDERRHGVGVAGVFFMKIHFGRKKFRQILILLLWIKLYPKNAYKKLFNRNV